MTPGPANPKPSTTPRSATASDAVLAAVATAIDTAIDAIGRVIAWSTFALAAVMGANVLLRYGFSLGAVWAQELEWHLMVLVCLFGISYAARHGEHVRVDVVFARLPRRWQQWIDLVAAIGFVIVCVLVILLSLSYVAASWRVDETSTNPGGIPYRYVMKAMIPVGFALLGLQSVARLLHLVVALRRGSYAL